MKSKRNEKPAKLTIPKNLQLGDTIGIICPSAGVDERAKHRITNGCKCLEKMGFKTKLGKSIISNSYIYLEA